MKALLIVAALIVVPTGASACWDEVTSKCSEAEREVRYNTDKSPPLLPAQWLFNYAKACAVAAILDTVRCPGEKLINGVQWTKEQAKDFLRDLGYDAGGIKLDVRPTGENRDLSGVRNKALNMLHSGS